MTRPPIILTPAPPLDARPAGWQRGDASTPHPEPSPDRNPSTSSSSLLSSSTPERTP